jgi:hypothetical protein
VHRPAWLETTMVARDGAGGLWDVGRPLPAALAPGAEYELLPFEDAAARDVAWHSGAHVLGAALETLYGDRVRLCDGPPMYLPRPFAPLASAVCLRVDHIRTYTHRRIHTHLGTGPH